ncbi:hypothetical protein MBH78_04925 [Oceanimonas sp. NS1]|nr:hypothetical protein [Oceanimonas sp. NS1]
MQQSLAAEAGLLQLNAMEPLIIHNLLNNCRMLSTSIRMLDRLCIRGIADNREQCARHMEQSIGIVTALVPHIGYDNASRIAGKGLPGIFVSVKQA